MAVTSFHFEERFLERIIRPKQQFVGFEHEIAKYKILGEYPIPEDIKSAIITSVDKIKDTNFQSNKNFAIKISYIPIEKDLIIYNADCVSVKETNPLVFIDQKTNSNGNVIFAIIRNNFISTLYFGKSYVPQTKEKLNVDFIINDIKNYKLRN